MAARTGSLPPALRSSSTTKILTWTVAVVALVYFLFPIYWVVVGTTKSNSDLLTTNPLWFGDNNIAANYRSLQEWTQGLFWRWVGNSVLYSTVAGVVGTLVSVSAGYGLAKFRFPGRGAVQIVVLSGLLLPIALLTVPLYLMFLRAGMTDTVWSIIIPSCVSPFGVFLGRIYAEGVPDELVEAARIDGAGELRIFFSVVLRLLAPAMVTIFLFIFTATWNNFLLPLMMVSSPDLKPVTLGIYGMMSYFNPQYGAVLQAALLGVLPLVVLFLGLQRFWRSGLAAGAVKG